MASKALIKAKNAGKKAAATITKAAPTKGEEPPFREILDIGEIIPDSGGKSKLKVRIIERNSDKVVLTDIRQYVDNPGKFTGFTGKGLSLADPDQIQELIDLLIEAQEYFSEDEKPAKKKKAKEEAPAAKKKAKK